MSTRSCTRLVHDQLNCTDLGEADIKGFGSQTIYSLDSESSGRIG